MASHAKLPEPCERLPPRNLPSGCAARPIHSPHDLGHVSLSRRTPTGGTFPISQCTTCRHVSTTGRHRATPSSSSHERTAGVHELQILSKAQGKKSHRSLIRNAPTTIQLVLTQRFLLFQIKCNRLRPACEACQVFQCACIYGKSPLVSISSLPWHGAKLTLAHLHMGPIHLTGCPFLDAVPKKRGPKTDILEALLKRVDGLEQKLKDQKEKGGDEAGGEGSEASGMGSGSGSGISPSSDESPGAATATATVGESSTSPGSKTAATDVPMTEQPRKQSKSKGPEMPAPAVQPKDDPELFSSQQQQDQTPPVQVDALLHTYFTRSHAKPFHILDESSFRQRLLLGQIPSYLLSSVCALASR